MNRIRVGILFGGRSAEHEVSILSARNILAAIDRERFEPVLIAIDKAGRWLLPSEVSLLQAPEDPRLVRIDPSAPTTAIQPSPGRSPLGLRGPAEARCGVPGPSWADG